MLETKYGLKYPMPHVLVHIVDNSSYTGELGVLVADDPSMYGTIVVTGTPMGEDRRVVAVDRSDVLNIGYGLGSLGTGDIQKYGQTVTYPMSLIAQGAPVKLLRVTPDDACYAYSCITVEWRWNPIDRMMHVRYNSERLPDDRTLSNYSNRERLNAAIVKAVNQDNVPAASDDPCQVPWKKRAFIVNISAGRGSAYNVMSTAIQQTIQGRRPTNVRYLFTTTDTSKSSVVEQFYASLINVDNGSGTDSIESVNVVVKKRAEGSSIVVPFVNESAIRELYNEYRAKYAEMMETDGVVVDDYIREAYAFTNINTFDPVFGLYIYNGTDEYVKLPFLQVDMRSSDIQMLPMSNRLYTTADGNNHPELLADKVMSLTYGVTRDGDSVYLGDVYLYAGTSSLNNPYIYIVGVINQYTGAVTTVKTNKFTVNGVSTQITTVIETNTNSASDKQVASNVLRGKLRNGIVKDGDVIAWYVGGNSNTWELYSVNAGAAAAASTTTFSFDTYTTILDTANGAIFKLVDWAAAKCGNLIGTEGGDTTTATIPDPAYNRIGATVIDTETGKVYINMYDYETPDEYPTTFSTAGRLEITNFTKKYGQPDIGVDVNEAAVGTEFDIITVDGSDADAYKIDASAIPSATTDDDYGSTTNTTNKVRFLSATYTVTTEEPSDWATNYGSYYVKNGTDEAFTYSLVTGDTAPTWAADTYYSATYAQSLFDLVSNTAPAGGYSLSLQNYLIAENDIDTESIGNYVLTMYDTIQGLLDGTTTTFTSYTVTTAEPADWATNYTDYFTRDGNRFVAVTGESAPTWEANTYYASAEETGDAGKVYLDLATNKLYTFVNDTYTEIAGVFRLVTTSATDPVTGLYQTISTTPGGGTRPSGVQFNLSGQNVFVPVVGSTSTPTEINRYMITGALGSLFRVQQETGVNVPADYYSNSYGINITASDGGVRLADGYTGFFDDDISDIEFKWRYSQLLVQAYKGQMDPRIKSTTRVPAKYLFDGGTNTIIGQTILPSVKYSPAELISASTIFTEDEKDEILLNPDIITWESADIDVKQAMYDLMIFRVYQGIPEDKRPIGPGSGLSLHLDAGVTDATVAAAVNTSFGRRFDNPNASWELGGYVSAVDGIAYTYTKRIADNLVSHCKQYSVNKPFVNAYAKIPKNEYVSFFPDIDIEHEWDYRETMYRAGGNAWLMDVQGNLVRKSQRTMMRSSDTSDLIQESNMRTLSQLVYMLQNKLEEKLFEYNDDSILKTLQDECNNMFSNWVGNLVDGLDISFVRDTNPLDGGEIVVCYVNVVFRGINLRIPVIVNVNRRTV